MGVEAEALLAAPLAWPEISEALPEAWPATLLAVPLASAAFTPAADLIEAAACSVAIVLVNEMAESEGKGKTNHRSRCP